MRGAISHPTLAGGDRARDAERTARLLLDDELAAGTVDPTALDVAPVRRAAAVGPVPSLPRRLVHDVARKLGRLDWERAVAQPLIAARRAALGGEAAAPPRFLIRVDEFPHYQAWDEPDRFGTAGFERFHELATAAGVPYLVAVLPRVSREPLRPAADGGRARALDAGERALLERLRADGVAFALHGRDHRTRFASARRHSELCGLDAAETEALLDEALAALGPTGIAPTVFVAPYNRFDAAQLPLLARRFEVVCGGPESIRQLGFQRGPQWRGDAVYLPSYAPLYGHADDVLPAIRRAIAADAGLWWPVTLHWGWEAERGWRGLERLLDAVAPYAARWEDFLAAVRRSRGAGS